MTKIVDAAAPAGIVERSAVRVQARG